tara:strand:+ start:6272 stop:6460 length:189 start_codon:yes stop_codon:yes gene_type:complete
VGLHTAASISVLVGILSLLPARNFPATDSREFLAETTVFAAEIKSLGSNIGKISRFTLFFPC